MDSLPAPRFLVAGRLTRDTILDARGGSSIDCPGGSLLYAAAGIGLWEPGIGLLSRVGPDYPTEWLDRIARGGLDIRGIRRIPEPVDQRRFLAYSEAGVLQPEDPVAQFARRGLPFPKDLLGYQAPENQLDSRTRLSIEDVRVTDIPSDYLDAAAAHIAPLDYLAHTLLPSTLRQGHITTLTLDPAPGYMNPTFWDDIPVVLTGLTAFLTNEEKLRSLFLGRSDDLWEMAEALSHYGCEVIVIKRGEKGQYLYDGSRRARYILPAYPVQLVDPTGAGDAFCGGFLAGLRGTYEPLQAALWGSISAAMTVEGRDAFYTLHGLRRLAEARAQALREGVRRA